MRARMGRNLPFISAVWCLGYAAIHLWWVIGGTPAFMERGESVFLPGVWVPAIPAALATASGVLIAVGSRREWSTLARQVIAGTGAAAGVAMVAYCFLFWPGLANLLLVPFGVPMTDPGLFVIRTVGVVGGTLALWCARVEFRRTGPACDHCGRRHGRLSERRTDPSPWWAYAGAYLAVAGLVTRLIPALQRHGTGASLLDGPGGVGFSIVVVGLVLAGTLLPLALAHRWGRIWPWWVRPWANRPVPRWLVLGPGVFMGVGLCLYFGVGGMTAMATGETATDAVVEISGYTAWGVGLLVASVSYYRLTRPECPADRQVTVADRYQPAGPPAGLQRPEVGTRGSRSMVLDLFDQVDPDLGGRLRGRLDAVEDLLRQHLTLPDGPLLTDAALHLITAGGKRMRPLLVLLAAEFGPSSRDDAVVRAAALVELVHVGSLYHDDVMDEAALRHGVAAGHLVWGNRAAILAGDYILAKAAELGAELGIDAVHRHARTLTRLFDGQFHESIGPRPGQPAISHYERVIAEKSAALLAMAVQLGATAAGAPASVVESLTVYAERVGTAFQMSDDVLDIVADSTVSGKTPGTDLREGVRSLPVLYTLQSGEPDAVRLRELIIDGPVRDDVGLNEALTILRRSPGTVQAYLQARQHAHRARQALRQLPDIPARHALTRLSELVTKRMA